MIDYIHSLLVMIRMRRHVRIDILKLDFSFLPRATIDYQAYSPFSGNESLQTKGTCNQENGGQVIPRNKLVWLLLSVRECGEMWTLPFNQLTQF
jgi:hypothetical protein